MLTSKEKEQIIRSSGVNVLKCMRCGKCTGTCPAYDEMEYHPHEFVYMVEKGEIEKLMNSPSIYKCLTCFACVERCPRGENHIKAEDIPCIMDDDTPGQLIVSAFRKYKK